MESTEPGHIRDFAIKAEGGGENRSRLIRVGKGRVCCSWAGGAVED